MKRILLNSLFLLILLLPQLTFSKDTKFEMPANAIPTKVILFKNATGDPSLDWISYGMQKAMVMDLTYIHGLELFTRNFMSSIDALDRMNRVELIESAKQKRIRQLWIGEFQGGANRIKLDISVVDVVTGGVSVKKQIDAPLKNLLLEASKAAIEIAKEMGVSISLEEEKRVMSPKTESVDAWRAYAMGLHSFEKFLFMAEAGGDKNKAIEIAGKSLQLLNESVTIDENYAEAWTNLGLLYSCFGQGQKALNAYKKALEIKPFLISANLGMYFVLKSLQKKDKAIEYIKKAVNINPSLMSSYILLLAENALIGDRDEVQNMMPIVLQSASPAISTEYKKGILKVLRDKEYDRSKSVSIAAEALYNPDQSIRKVAGDVLYLIASNKDVPVLIEILNHHPDNRVRSSILFKLGELRNKAARDVLIKMLQDPDDGLRIGAVRALGMQKNEFAVPALIIALNDSNKKVNSVAAWSLGQIGDESAVPALIDRMKNHTDKGVRKSAACALGKIGGEMAVAALEEVLKAHDEDLYIDAAKSLYKNGNKTWMPFLVKALESPNKKNRRNAAYTLGDIGDKTVIPSLLKALKDSDWVVRENAAVALGKLGDKSDIPALKIALKDPNKSVRYASAKALGRLGDKTALPVLIEALKDPNRSFTLDPELLIGKIGDKSVVPALIEILQHPEESGQRGAVKALLLLRDKAAIPALLNMLKNPDVEVRIGAAIALYRMGERKGVPVLIDILHGKDGIHYYDEILPVLTEIGKVNVLYEIYIKKTHTDFFNHFRRNLLFLENFDILTGSEDTYLKSTGYYLLALKAREEGRYEEQLKQSQISLSHIEPKNMAGLAFLILWMKARAELKLDRPKRALETILKAETYVDYLSPREYFFYDELFEEYTLFLQGEVYSALGDRKNAMLAYELALEGIERAKEDILMSKSQKDMAIKLEAIVRTGLGIVPINMGKENLQKAVEGGRVYLASDSVEMENEEKRYFELARQKIAEGDYEESQKLMEELNLRRTKYINRRMKLKLADPKKQAHIDTFRKKKDEIEDINRKIDRERKGGKGGIEKDDRVKGLELERNKKRRELKRYLTKLKKTHPDIAALLGAKPMELTAIQEQLPENVAILQYMMLPDKLVVFVLGNQGIDIVETQIKKKELKTSVKKLRKEINALARGKSSKKITPLSAMLNDILIKPIEDAGMLKGIKVVGLAPNSFLHLLPFGALINDKGLYLVDRYNLFFINSTSILGVAMDRSSVKKQGGVKLLALANPDGSLDYADIEAKNIAKLFDKKKLYSQKDAKKSVVQNEQADYSILHLATHGIFDPIDSTKSHLVMADSKLFVEEIWGLPLKGISLTVLSACETGWGEVLSGDDVVSLENAFIYAGSPSVLATLWKVADRSTAEMMVSFYRNLLKGMTKAQALSTAQRDLKKQYDHPFYWAAFTLRGDWR